MAAQEMSFEGGVISMEGYSFMATDKQLAGGVTTCCKGPLPSSLKQS